MESSKWRLVLIFMVLLSSSASALSLGISPSALEFKQVLKGGYAERTATISTSSPTPTDISISAEGQIREWVTVGEESFILDPLSRKSISIKIRPPENTPNGVYTGSIIASARPSATSEGAMGAIIVTAVEMQVSAEVTGDQIVSFEVESATAKDTEEGQPLEFNVIVANTGNTRITPAIRIEVLDKDGKALKSLDYAQTEILPTKSQDILIKVPNDLALGGYTASITTSVGEEKVERKSAFSVLERGSLRLQRELLTIKTDKVWADAGDVVELTAEFRNTGQLVATAQFKGKAYLEGTLVDLIEGDEMDVPVGETAELKSYYTPKKAGRYKIAGWVYYSKKTTKENFVILNVQEPKGTAPQEKADKQGDSPTTLYAAIAVLVAVIAALAFMLLRRGR